MPKKPSYKAEVILKSNKYTQQCSCEMVSAPVHSHSNLVRTERLNWGPLRLLARYSFHRNTQAHSCVIAELWAIREGLNFALTENIKSLDVEVDALVAIQLLSTTNIGNHPLSNIVHYCRFLSDLI